MPQDNKPRLTDFHTFWKLIVLVVIALFAEGFLLIAATSDDALDWTSGQFNNPAHQINKAEMMGQ